MIRTLAFLLAAWASAAGADTSGLPPAAKPKLYFKPMPRGTPAKIVDLVAAGDRIYAQAMERLEKSDPKDNPKWLEENKAALALFQGASKEAYIPAQEEYTANPSIPEELQDRVRETQMRAFFCRKRSVSARR